MTTTRCVLYEDNLENNHYKQGSKKGLRFGRTFCPSEASAMPMGLVSEHKEI